MSVVDVEVVPYHIYNAYWIFYLLTLIVTAGAAWNPVYKLSDTSTRLVTIDGLTFSAYMSLGMFLFMPLLTAPIVFWYLISLFNTGVYSKGYRGVLTWTKIGVFGLFFFAIYYDNLISMFQFKHSFYTSYTSGFTLLFGIKTVLVLLGILVQALFGKKAKDYVIYMDECVNRGVFCHEYEYDESTAVRSSDGDDEIDGLDEDVENIDF